MELVSVIVVPACDEEEAIAACLEALAAQTVPAQAFEVVLVADACSDRTEEVARAAAARLGLTLSVHHGPGAGSGPARRIGMDAAADRLMSLGLPRGLIATTDADSTPSPDWLARQLAHLHNGADVIAGLIELADADAACLPDAVLDRRRRDAEARMIEVVAADPQAGTITLRARRWASPPRSIAGSAGLIPSLPSRTRRSLASCAAVASRSSGPPTYASEPRLAPAAGPVAASRSTSPSRPGASADATAPTSSRSISSPRASERRR